MRKMPCLLVFICWLPSTPIHLACPAYAESNAADAPSGMIVMQATFGGNCGAKSNNALDDLKKWCDGVSGSCEYPIEVSALGDPSPGCKKDFSVRYLCSPASASETAYIPAEAGLSRGIALQCGNPSAKATVTSWSLKNMYECENGRCAIWAFDGSSGYGRWNRGVIANLELRGNDPSHVIIERKDINQPFSAEYTGVVANGRVQGGIVQWHFPGGRQVAGTWEADVNTISNQTAKSRADAAEESGQAYLQLSWLLPSAYDGDAASQTAAAKLLQNPNAGPVNPKLAVALLNKAAAQNYDEAAMQMGHLYEQGFLVQKSQVTADFWFNKAGDEGKEYIDRKKQQRKNEQQVSEALAGLFSNMLGSVVRDDRVCQQYSWCLEEREKIKDLMDSRDQCDHDIPYHYRDGTCYDEYTRQIISRNGDLNDKLHRIEAALSKKK